MVPTVDEPLWGCVGGGRTTFRTRGVSLVGDAAREVGPALTV